MLNETNIIPAKLLFHNTLLTGWSSRRGPLGAYLPHFLPLGLAQPPFAPAHRTPAASVGRANRVRSLLKPMQGTPKVGRICR